MQQTPNYQLNLIETDDPLSPAPLNGNAEKLDAALAAETETRRAETGGLDRRVRALEFHRMAIGTYTGNYAELQQTIELPFTPAVVFVSRQKQHITALALADHPGWSSHVLADVTIIPNGFTVGHERNAGSGAGLFNTYNELYHYIAFV